MSSLPRSIGLTNYSRIYVWNHPELGIEYHEPIGPTIDREDTVCTLLKCESCGLNGFSQKVKSKSRGWRCPCCSEETYMKKCSDAFLWCSVCRRVDELECSVSQMESLPPCSNPDCNGNLLSIVFLFDEF